jgi:cathepsin F
VICIELVDCDKVDEGCNGGFMTVAYDQIINMSGLMTEEDYKYEGKQHNQCQLDKKKIKVDIDGYLNITSDENGKRKILFNEIIDFIFVKRWLNGWQIMHRFQLD